MAENVFCSIKIHSFLISPSLTFPVFSHSGDQVCVLLVHVHNKGKRITDIIPRKATMLKIAPAVL